VLANTADDWGAPAKFFHWTVALLVVVQVGLGFAAALWRLSPLKLDLFVWHKSVGILILALMLARLVWRLANRAPALPPQTPAWERHAAHASHGLLYALAIALPLSGWVINSAAAVPFSVFWLLPLPPIVAPDEGVVLAVHIGAALRHHLVKHDAVLLRMLPASWKRA
jgi:cytochrome b561